MVIRRMKPLGFTLDEMRDLLGATDRLDALPPTGGDEREAIQQRVAAYEQAATQKVEDLRVQLARAEEFAADLRARLTSAHNEAPTPLDPAARA